VADIFVSYARVDKARVAPLVAALEAQGWSVWWDPEIAPGQEFDSQISAALDAARAVVVVWTPRSVDSRWVRGEAREAADRGVLAPVRFEAARLPIDFRALHTTDLDDWREDVSSRPFEDLLRALKPLIGGKSAVAEPAPARRALSICVLPFANMSGDAEQEYFADGISEDIITDLSKVSALSVIARNSAFAFKGKSVDIKQVARQLEVAHVLEGSVRRAGNRVRITAQLINGATNDNLWAERWDRDLDDIFALQDEISQAIVGALKLKLLPEEKKAIGDRGTASLEAYDKYLRARALANSASTVPDFYRALDLCRQALDIDPEFAQAYSALVSLYAYVETWAPKEREQLRKDRYALADQAVARAPNFWGTHLLNGMRLAEGKDWFAALTAFEEAVKLAPASEADVPLLFASGLAIVGRMSDAVAVLEKARAADPLSALISQRLQIAYFMIGRDDDSRAEYQRSLDLRGIREAMEHTALFREWDLGDGGRTVAQFHRYLDSQTIKMPFLADCLEALDRPGAAGALLAKAVEDPVNHDGTRAMIIGLHAGLYGDEDLTVRAMRLSLLDLDYTAKYMLWWPFRNGARRTPAFKQLVRDLGVYDYWRRSGQWGDFARPLGDDDFELIG
jgi:adenylate cyclase